MLENVIEGPWEIVIQRPELHGHYVRIIVMDTSPLTPQVDPTWIDRVRASANSHRPVDHFADDSSENIYGGTLDDPR